MRGSTMVRPPSGGRHGLLDAGPRRPRDSRSGERGGDLRRTRGRVCRVSSAVKPSRAGSSSGSTSPPATTTKCLLAPGDLRHLRRARGPVRSLRRDDPTSGSGDAARHRLDRNDCAATERSQRDGQRDRPPSRQHRRDRHLRPRLRFARIRNVFSISNGDTPCQLVNGSAHRLDLPRDQYRRKGAGGRALLACRPEPDRRTATLIATCPRRDLCGREWRRRPGDRSVARRSVAGSGFDVETQAAAGASRRRGPRGLQLRVPP